MIKRKKLKSPHVNANKIMLVTSDQETDEDWNNVGAKNITDKPQPVATYY